MVDLHFGCQLFKGCLRFMTIVAISCIMKDWKVGAFMYNICIVL